MENVTAEQVFEIMRTAKDPDWINGGIRGDVKFSSKLITGAWYGTRAMDIYLDCCKVFGWDETEAWHFGPQQLLYARGAAPKGYSPWFLVHHKAIDSSTTNTNWKNVITEDTVYEEWDEVKEGFYSDFTPRITFAKSKTGYVYIGIFVPQKDKLIEATDPVSGRLRYVKIYKKIQDNYEG